MCCASLLETVTETNWQTRDRRGIRLSQITSFRSSGNVRFETERIFKFPRSDLLNVGLADFAQTDFWPGTVSGLLVERERTARRASPGPASTLTSLDPRP